MESISESSMLFYCGLLLLIRWSYFILESLLFYYRAKRNPKSSESYLKEKFGEWAVVIGIPGKTSKAYMKELASRGINICIISNSHEEKFISDLKSSFRSIECQHLTNVNPTLESLNNVTEHLATLNIGFLVQCSDGKIDTQSFTEYSEIDVKKITADAIELPIYQVKKILPLLSSKKRGMYIHILPHRESFETSQNFFSTTSQSLMEAFFEAVRVEVSFHGIESQSLQPLINSKALKAIGLSEISPEEFAANCINNLGKNRTTTGHWLHDILVKLHPWLLYPLKLKI